MKIAYMIIPEPHFTENNFETMPGYMAESIRQQEFIIKTVYELKEVYDKVIVLFPGDVFHKGIVKSKASNYYRDFFEMLHDAADGVFSAVGNHELNFMDNNQFWHYMSKIESTYVKNHDKRPTAKGIKDLIRVVDEIVDGEVSFHFGHYGYRPKTTNKVNVLVTHNTAANAELKRLATQTNNALLEEHYTLKASIINEFYFDYVYVGHLHTWFSNFSLDMGARICNWSYLGSFGRTASNTVNDQDRKRLVPVHVTEDGKHLTRFNIEYTLPERSEFVSEPTVNKSKERYLERKKEFLIRERMIRSGDPIRDVLMTLESMPLACKLFEDARESEVCDILTNIVLGE